MKPAPNATQGHTSPDQPAGASATESSASGTNAGGDEHAARGEVAAVAGPDQHPVEDEHQPGDRLDERRDEQHRRQQVPAPRRRR